jgi:5-carboxymethyl-2-hydroxymuconate isomerase
VAHIVIEHSSNLRRQLNLPKFVEAIRQAALATGIFPRDRMHTRSYESEPYCAAAQCASDSTFVHLCVRVGQGCEDIFAAACEQLREVHARAPLGISVEMQDLEPDSGLKATNIRDYAAHVRARR